ARFCHWLGRGLFPRRRFGRWLDTRAVPFPGQPDRTLDTVAGLVHVEALLPPIACGFEFKAEPDPGVFEQVTAYQLAARRGLRTGPHDRDKYEVVGVIVNLTGAEQAAVWAMAPADCPELGTQVKCGLVSLAQLPAAPVLEEVAAGQLDRWVLAWVSAM